MPARPIEASAGRERVRVRIRPPSGWAALDVPELWRFRDLLTVLAARDIKLRYRQTLLGVGWVIFQPLVSAAIFTLVFEKIAGLSVAGVPYFVFVYAGQLAWTAFSSTFSKASSSLVSSSHLVSKVYVPRLILPLSTVASTLVDFAVGLTVVVAMLAVYRLAPGAAVLLLPVWLIAILLLSVGCGMIAAALMVHYRDVQYVVPVLLSLALYASPVGYSFGDAMAKLPASLGAVLWVNPLASLLESFRWSLLGTAAPSPASTAYGVVMSVGVFAAGATVFTRMERTFADAI